MTKILTIFKIFSVTVELSTGLIILGIVAFMMGIFASMIFKRQAFVEKDIRHHLEHIRDFKE